jgi:hypothetical protein
LNVVVIASHEADLRQRAALDRALRLQPARIVRAPLGERWRTARAIAGDAAVDWIVFVDDDVVPVVDAFGALARTLAKEPAVVGGRALVGGEQRFGMMFGAPRWGPDPVELSAISAPESLGTVVDAMRGPMDAPARGLVIVGAPFVRRLDDELDPCALHLDLGLHARRTGDAVWCEPRMTFATAPDPPDVVRNMPRLLRKAGTAWPGGPLHRDPPGPRERLIGREVRVAGNIRGYERRPYPPASLLVVGQAPAKTVAALRAACNAADATTCNPNDVALLRRRLTVTSDRYLAVVPADARFTRADFVALVERLEHSGRHALAVTNARAPFGPAVVHLGRIAGGDELAGTTVADAIADAVTRLPAQRLFATGPEGTIVPSQLPPIVRPPTLSFIMLAASKPNATRQTFDALSQAIGTNRAVAIIAAGAATSRRILAAWPETVIVEDEVDPNLGTALNRVLGEVESDLVLIVRDDAHIPKGAVRRLHEAFGRIAGLAAAVPRVNTPELAEALTGITYRDLNDMESFTERRAALYAREAQLVPLSAAPVLMLSRAALQRIGGFDPALAFTRFGIVDFTRRLTLANLPLARCEDAFAHVFDPDSSGSLLGASDTAAALAAIYERRWSDRSAFEPERDRVPLGGPATPPAAAPAAGPAFTVLLPLADEVEWEAVRSTVTALATTFTIADPVEIVVGVDGPFGVQRAARALHEILTTAPVPLERTIAIRIEPVADLAAWRDATAHPVRLAATARPELAGLPAIDGVLAARALLATGRGA